MIKTYKQKNEHELAESIKNRAIKHIYVKALFCNGTEDIEVSREEILNVIHKFFKKPNKRIRAVHIQDAIYLK